MTTHQRKDGSYFVRELSVSMDLRVLTVEKYFRSCS
jgi:hypothetical protein